MYLIEDDSSFECFNCATYNYGSSQISYKAKTILVFVESLLLPPNVVKSLLLPPNVVQSLLLPPNVVESLLLPPNVVQSLLLPPNVVCLVEKQNYQC